MTADMTTPTTTPRKRPTMSNNPFQPEYQRPDRDDQTWQRRRDPVAYIAVQRVTRRGY